MGESYNNSESAVAAETGRESHVSEPFRIICGDALTELRKLATFPIELPETCLKAGSPEDGLVLDPFAGAGTVGLACIKNNRRFLGIELNPDYVAIAYARARRHYPLFAPEPQP